MCKITPLVWYRSMAPKERELQKLESCWFECLRTMVKGGWKRQEASEEGESEFRYVHTNANLQHILQTTSLRQEVLAQKMRYYGHICRPDNKSLTKQTMFAESRKPYVRDPLKKLANECGIEITQLLKMTQSRPKYKGFIDQMKSASERRVR